MKTPFLEAVILSRLFNSAALLFLMLTFNSCADSFDVCLTESQTPSFTVSGGTKIWKCFDLKWETESTIIDYQVQLAREDDFGDDDIVVDEIVDDEMYRFAAPTRGTYFARVRSITGDCGSEWTEPLQLFFDIFPETACVSAEGVNVPSQVSPINGGNFPIGDLELDWNFVSGGLLYHFQIGPTEDFSDITIAQNYLEESTYTVELLEPGKYYWRVRAYDENNQHTAWSEVWSVLLEEN